MLLPDLQATFQHVTSTCASLHPLNNSYVVLIPKKEHATEPKDFRPISVVNAIQKIFSKILATRLQLILGTLIDESQTGFLKGRHITEGFLYVQQTIQYARLSNTPLAAFKDDTTKAFDTISWEYITHILQARGSPQTWISWIQNAVLEGHSLIIVNGLGGTRLELRRGVRQGDPISPYLFIFAMDFLARWVNKLVASGTWVLPWRHLKPCIFYADDSLFFLQPSFQQLQILKIVFIFFYTVLGLEVNLRNLTS